MTEIKDDRVTVEGRYYEKGKRFLTMPRLPFFSEAAAT